MRPLEDWIRRTWKGHGGEVFLVPCTGDPKTVCNADVSSQDLVKNGIVCMSLARYIQEQPSFENQIKRLRACDIIEYRREGSAIYSLECNRKRGFTDYEVMNGSIRIP